MKYSIRHIAEIVAGRLVQPRRQEAGEPIEHLLLDSRRLVYPASSLFIALHGPRRDGGRFMEELYRRGVRNFMVQAPAADGAMPEANIIFVEDTLTALQALAAWRRQQFSIPVIGITGSNGKTIVKEWLNQLLEADLRIVRSPKSYNSQTGVPLSVWQLEPAHELAIFEAGISRPGEMRRLEPMIRPTIGIFTMLGEAHNEGFASRGEKAAEKLILFERAEALIFCGDQEETSEAIRKWRGERAKMQLPAPEFVSWGREEGNAICVYTVERLGGATKIGLRFGAIHGDLTLPFTEQASIENAMHGIAAYLWLRATMGRPARALATGGIAAQAGTPIQSVPAELSKRVAALTPIAMRLELKAGINHCSIINDSYSADLSSLAIALDFLSQQQQHPKRSVILSDIPESGRPEQELYAEVARALQQKRIDRLIGIGPRIGAHAAGIGEWFDGETAWYPTVAAFRQELHRLHFHDETILLKGARVFEFEEIDRLLTQQIHQTVMEVDLNAMAANLRAYRQLLQPATRVMAMVKAFSYGSGSFEIANLLQFHGVDYLGVAYADEGVALRKGGIRMPIVIMNTENRSFDSLVQYNLEPVIYSFPLLRDFDHWLKKEGAPPFPMHIELDTGMNRLGFRSEEWDELVRVLPAAAFKVQSVFSHFAASEDADQDAFSLAQGAGFLTAAARLERALGYTLIKHISNSAGIVRYPQLQLDMVRLGIGLYGIDNAGGDGPQLHEISTLKTTIAQIKHLREGDTIGYNRRGIAVPGTVIATVRIGYADGYSRNLGNGAGKMWIRGRLAPTIGGISMDLTMIDITGIPGVQEGDEVLVFGKELSVSQLAEWAQTIPYEILTGVSQRVKRIYFEQ